MSHFIHLKKLQNYERSKDYKHCYSNCHFIDSDWGSLPCFIDNPLYSGYLCYDKIITYSQSECSIVIQLLSYYE